MANDFSEELKWWNKRAASYTTKRANIRPVSFEYLSKAYSTSGSLNGAANFDSSASYLSTFQRNFQNLATMDPSKVTGASGKKELTPLHASVAKPSADVLQLDKQLNTTEAKLKSLGSNAFRTVVGGLIRVADVISRPGYAIRGGALHYANENAAPSSDGGTDTTFGEHLENVFRPVFDILTMPRQLAGDQSSNTVYTDMNKGWTGRDKNSGTDILKVTFPEFTSDHKKWTSVLGFGVDVLYDPLSWVTVGQGTVVTGAAKGSASVGARMVGKHAVAQGLLDNTLWTKSGRAAGMRALEQGINARAAKPLTKQLNKLDKPINKANKNLRKAERKGDTAAQVAATAERTKHQLATEAVRTQLWADRQAVMEQTHTGVQLAYKALATKTLGLSSLGNFNRGVRAGGINNKATKELSRITKLTQDEATAKLRAFDSPEGVDLRLTHRQAVAHQAAGNELKVDIPGGKGATKTIVIPEDYDEFVDMYAGIAYRTPPVTELTGKALRGRKGVIAGADAEGKTFLNKFIEYAREADAADAGKVIDTRVAGPAAKAAVVAKKDSVEAVVKAIAAARTAKEAAAKGATNAAELAETARVARDAAKETATAAANAAKAAEEELARLTDEVDKALESMGVALSQRTALREAASASRAPEQMMADIQAGVDPIAASTRDALTAKQAAVVDAYKDQARQGISKIEGVTTSDTPEGFAINPRVPADPKNVDYARAVNLAIAEALSDAHELAKSVAVNTILDEDPELAFFAIQGATAHILNMLSADTHLQVSQFLSAKHGRSFLPMAPGIDVITGARLDPLRSSALDTQLPVLWSDPFTYKSTSGKTVTVHPDVMRAAASGRLQLEFDAAVKPIIAATPAGSTSPIDVTRYAAEFDSKGFDEYAAAVMRHAVNPSTGTTRFSTVPVYKTPGSDAGTTSLQDAVETFINLGLTLVHRDSVYGRTNVSDYSMLDYWMYTDNITDELDITSKGVGRLAHVKAPHMDPASTEAIAAAVETLPQVDENLVSAVKIIKAALRDVDNAPNANAGVSAGTAARLNRIVGRVIAPDVSRVTKGTMTTPDLDEAMQSLGYHLWVLTNTNEAGAAKFSIPFRIALAQRVWEIPALMQQLNQSLMLGTLHHMYAAKRTPEQAADKLAEFLAKYPLVDDLAKQANEAGVTSGSAGVRAPRSLSAAPDAAPASVGSVLADTGFFADNTVNTVAKGIDEAKAAVGTAKATQAKTAEALSDAEVVVKRRETAALGAADNLENSNKKLAELEAEKAAKEAGALNDPASLGNAPGGHSAPSTMDDATKDQIQQAIGDMSANVDIAGINAAIDRTQRALTKDMAEYSALMAERTKGMDIRVGRTLRFAGLPIAPLPSFNNPIHSYAGIVAIKESQSRVGNWLHIMTDTDKVNSKFQRYGRRPSSFEGQLNDMRRSSSNNAQNRILTIASTIHESFKQYKNKAELHADVKAYFDGDVEDIAEKLKPSDDRMRAISNHIFDTVFGKTPRAGTIVDRAKLQTAAKDFNNSLPRPFQLPEEIFDPARGNLEFVTDEVPFSREWLIGVSKHLQKVAPDHRLANGNVGKLDMAGFEFATQHALSRVVLRDEFHNSMFEHFTFAEGFPGQVAEWNKGLPMDEQYVQVHEIMGKAQNYGKDFKDRWVSRDMALEMQKVSQFVDGTTGYKMGDLNFGSMAKINNYWKAMVTTWNIPKYHIANLMSDSFMSAIDGTRLGHYEKAMTVMTNSHELSGRIKLDPQGYSDLMQPDLALVDVINPRHLDEAIAKAGDPTRARVVTRIMVNGRMTNLSSEDIMKMYVDYGLSQTQVNGNLLRSASLHGRNKASDAASFMSDKVLDLSNGREDYFRMAHFIHALENESIIPGRSLVDITKAARDRVIKYHFDYGDVTEWERLSLGRYMPFYKWTRNIVPLAMSQLFTNPKAYTIGNALNKTMGEVFFPTQEDANGKEIPASYITPSWVADAHMVPIGVYTDPNGNEQARYAVLNLPFEQALAGWIMPFMDPMFDPTKSTATALNEGFSNTVSSGLASMNPFVKAIMQAGLGKTPVPGDTYDAKPTDWLKTLAGIAFPASGSIQQIIKDDKTGAPMGDVQGWADNLGIIRQTIQTEASVKGTMREQQDRLNAILRKPETKWIQANHPGVDPNSEEGRKLIHKYYVEKQIVSK